MVWPKGMERDPEYWRTHDPSNNYGHQTTPTKQANKQWQCEVELLLYGKGPRHSQPKHAVCRIECHPQILQKQKVRKPRQRLFHHPGESAGYFHTNTLHQSKRADNTNHINWNNPKKSARVEDSKIIG